MSKPATAYYIIVSTDPEVIRRVLKLLSRFERKDKLHVYGVAIAVKAEDPRVLGGIKRIDSEKISLYKGILPLIKK